MPSEEVSESGALGVSAGEGVSASTREGDPSAPGGRGELKTEVLDSAVGSSHALSSTSTAT